MTRTSPAEVRGLYRRLVGAAWQATPRDLWDQHDCPSNPASWALTHDSAAGYSIERAYDGPIFLGRNTREAAIRLDGMVKALEMVPAREGVR